MSKFITNSIRQPRALLLAGMLIAVLVPASAVLAQQRPTRQR